MVTCKINTLSKNRIQETNIYILLFSFYKTKKERKKLNGSILINQKKKYGGCENEGHAFYYQGIV